MVVDVDGGIEVLQFVCQGEGEWIGEVFEFGVFVVCGQIVED